MPISPAIAMCHAVLGFCFGFFCLFSIRKIIAMFPSRHDRRGNPLEAVAVLVVSTVWSVAIALTFDSSFLRGVYLSFGGLLIVLSFVDIRTYLLPDVLTIPGTVASIFVSTVFVGTSVQDSFGGAILGGAGLYFFAYAFRKISGKEGIGLGDAKLLMLIGAMLGVSSLPIVVISGSVLALVFCFFVALRHLKTGSVNGGKIPFGPFLSLGAGLYVLFGDALWTLYRYL